MKINKKLLSLYFKFRKIEIPIYFIKVLGFVITCFTIFLLLFLENLNGVLLSNVGVNNTTDASQTQFVYVSNIILNIFCIMCIFILTYACINFSNFSSIKNNRRINILRALGINKKQEFLFDFIDIIFISLISTILSNILADYVFKYMLNTTFNVIINLNIISYILNFIKVFILAISIQLLVLYININNKTSIWSNLREQEENYKFSIYKKILIFIWFLFNIYFFSQNIYISILGSIALILIVFLIYILIKFALNVFIKVFCRNNKYNINSLTIKVMKKRNKKNSIFLSIICISILILYFIINIDWGLERFLEKYWEDTHNYNIGILTEKSKEINIENDLTSNKIPYLKVYAKEFPQYIFVITNKVDNKSPFYVEQGTIRTINYNLHKNNLKEGDNIKVDDKNLKISTPLKEYGFLLLSYNVLGNYNDFKDKIDDSYFPVFLVLSKNFDTFKNVENISEKYNSEFLNSKNFMQTLNIVFKDYINLMKFIFVILVFLIFVFIIISAILSITLRKKEIFTYWTVGGTIKQIKKVILLEYFYLSIIVTIVSSIIFIIIFNLFQLIYFNNSTFYNLPLNIMFLGIMFTLLLILGIVFIILTNFCKNKSYLMTRED